MCRGGGCQGEGLPSPGVLAPSIARGAVVRLRQRCPRVKRDGTAGLIGCSIKLPPKAAPPSRRVRPPASIALDRDHGKPSATVDGELRSLGGPGPAPLWPGPWTPTLVGTRVPTPATCVLLRRLAAGSLVMALRGGGAVFMTVPGTRAMFGTPKGGGQWDGRHSSSGVMRSLGSNRSLVESPTRCGGCASTGTWRSVGSVPGATLIWRGRPSCSNTSTGKA
jgi:hypothetical protein